MRLVHRRMLNGCAAVLTALIFAVSCTGVPPARSTLRQSLIPTPAGQPPEVIASDAFLCPPGYAFGAYGSLFYPPTYPSPPPPSARPARCYPSAVEAEAGGYALAPTPEGDLQIGLVYLVPTDHAFLAVCRAAGARLGFPVSTCSRWRRRGIG